MKTKLNTKRRGFFQHLITKNFWYDVSLKTTIWKTIGQVTDFNREEIDSIKKSYADLRKLNSNLVDDIQSEYHVSWCSILLSIYKICLLRGMPQTEAMDLAERILFTNMKAQSISKYIESALDKAADPFAYMVKSSKNQENSFFGNTFLFKREIDNKDSYHLSVKKCLYYDYFRLNNAPELMRVACRWDMVSWTQGIVPDKHKITFQRPVTLGLDGKDCAFIFDRMEKPGE